MVAWSGAAKGLRWIVPAVVLAVGVLVTQDFFGYVDRFPYLALDDSLANVSATLAETGRYGFMASPILRTVMRKRSGDAQRMFGIVSTGDPPQGDGQG